MGTRTPWGTAQSSTVKAPGIVSYSTAGHGGIKLDREHNAGVHPAWRKAGGWYEEDLDWAIVAFTYPEAFEDVEREHVVATLRDWMPDEYTVATGEALTAENSRKLRHRAARIAYANAYIAVAAYGAWHKLVPTGFVGVTAVRGGRLENGRYASTDEKCFLVPADEYDVRTHTDSHVEGLGFVVDPARHQEIGALS